MKKTFLSLIALLSLPFLLTACSFGNDDAGHIDEAQLTENSGVLYAQAGVYLDLPGTHYLKIESGENLPLASLMFNLSDSQYLENKVKVAGVMKESAAKEEYLEVEKIEVLEQMATSKWETYKSPEFGVSVSYKSDWQASVSDDVLTFASKDKEPVVKITRFVVGKDVSLKDALGAQVGSKASQAVQSLIGPDKMVALKIESFEDKDVAYYLKRDSYLYKIAFDGDTSDKSLEYRNIFNEMLLDFRFIEIDDSETKSDELSKDDSTSSAGNDEATENADYAKVVGVLKSSPATVNDELAALKVSKVEFVGEHYMFVEGYDGTEHKRFLLEYSAADLDATSTIIHARYVPGETTDWVLKEGSNPVLGQEKTVYVLSGGSSAATVVKAGYRYFESPNYMFKMQYPAAWYYAGRTASSVEEANPGLKYVYSFSDKPVEPGNVLLSVEIYERGKGTSLSGNATMVSLADYDVVVNGTDQETVSTVAASIAEF